MFDILADIKANGEIHREELCSDNIITYEVGTNGHMYNNNGSGTYSFVSLRDVACTNWNIVVERDEWGHMKGLKLFAEGDAELDLLAEAFTKIGQGLKEMGDRFYTEREEGARKLVDPKDTSYLMKGWPFMHKDN